jgi:excisionase family DNA binding protein
LRYIFAMIADGIVSAPEAAHRLGVNSARVRAMLAAGQLRGVKLGGRWLVSEASIRERERMHPQRGRPLHPKNAWAALLLSSGEPAWDLAHDERGVLGSLDRWGLDGLAPRLRGRASVHRFYAHPGVLRRLASRSELFLAGASGAGQHGLELLPGDELDAYVDETGLEGLVHEFGLEQRAEGGNVVLRSLPDGIPAFQGSIAPLAAVGLDLAEQGDARSNRIGRRVLRQLDSERRWLTVAR